MRLNVLIFRELMRARKIRSVAALSRKSGVSKATIFRLMAGKVDASFPTARALADALDTTVETLFPSEGRP